MLRLYSAASTAEPFSAPLFLERCQAGFPSPAADYTESELDLNEYCIQRRSSTYFVRAIGNSMRDMGLHSGDLLIVDKAERPQHGDIVIAEIDGEFTVKKLLLTPRPGIQAMNPPTLPFGQIPITCKYLGSLRHSYTRHGDGTDVRLG